MSHFIELAVAEQMTALYRTTRETILDIKFRKQDLLPLSETFDAAAFRTVMDQPGCVKLRIYYGMSTDLKKHAIIVGVDGNDKDILPKADSVLAEESKDRKSTRLN